MPCTMLKLLVRSVSQVYVCESREHFAGVVRYVTWKSVERRSVMASTADIQVNANRGRTTQELHREALSERESGREGQRGGGGRKRNSGVQSQTRPVSSGKSHNSSLSHTHTHTDHA